MKRDASWVLFGVNNLLCLKSEPRIGFYFVGYSEANADFDALLAAYKVAVKRRASIAGPTETV